MASCATPVVRLVVAAALAVTALLAVARLAQRPAALVARRPVLPGARLRDARRPERSPRRCARRSRARSARDLRAIDPERSGSPQWVAYNARFYERRVAVPFAAAADRAARRRPRAPRRLARRLRRRGARHLLAAAASCASGCRSPPAATLPTIFLPALTFHAGLPADRQLGPGARGGRLRAPASWLCAAVRAG